MIGEADTRKPTVATFVAITSAVALGLVCGFAAVKWQIGFSYLALPAGLAAALSIRLWGIPCQRSALFITLVAVGLGLAAHALVLYWANPKWTAEREIFSKELDGLTKEIIALQICHHRKIMGVWDYQGIPESIKVEATQQLAGMPRKEKLAFCDKTFGKRVNRASESDLLSKNYWRTTFWISLTIALTLAPLFYSRSEMKTKGGGLI